MLQWPRFEVLGISRRDFALVFTLLFNAFTWSYMTVMIIESIPLSSTVRSSFSAVFYIAASGAGLSGALLSEKIKRLRFLYLWIILGIIGSFLLIFINVITVAHLSIIFILLGISFGLGMPLSLAHFADNSAIENRALISSLILLAANLCTFPIAISIMAFNPVVNAVFLTIWRVVGLVVFILLKPKDVHYSDKKKYVSFVSVFRNRSFFLYLLPWIMFCLIDALEKALLLNVISSDLQRLMLTVEPIVGVLFIFIAGLLTDRIGRKKMAIYGFVSLGIGYAIVSLAPMITEAWYFYFVIDGIAWGILSTIFILTLWGDLSPHGAREKYYAVASFPLGTRSAIPVLLTTVIASIPPNAAFSLASFFLFLSVIPLMYAPETLPEKKMELRRLKGYVEQAKKVRDKHLRKSDVAES